MCGLLVRGGSRVLFDRHAEFVELAGILAVLGSDAFWDGLHAFKLGAGVEVATLFAAVKLGVAFRASTAGIEARSEDSAAVRAARAGDGTDHARRARAEVIVLSARTASGRPLFGTCFSVFFFRIAVTAMAVLTIHKRLRASGLLLAGSDYLLQRRTSRIGS